jgi:platelet-activating factor acetylhydrolase
MCLNQPSLENNNHPSWLPKTSFYTRGYGNFSKLSPYLSYLFGVPLLSFFTKPSHWEANVHPEATKMPVCIFSHGLGGIRTTYSGLCGNLASKGFLVVAIEFSDKSASRTHRSDNVIEYTDPHKSEMLPNETQDEHLLRYRSNQIQHRTEETFETIELLKKLNDGETIENLFKSTFDWTQLKSRLDLDNIVLAGHSFGCVCLTKGRIYAVNHVCIKMH